MLAHGSNHATASALHCWVAPLQRHELQRVEMICAKSHGHAIADCPVSVCTCILTVSMPTVNGFCLVRASAASAAASVAHVELCRGSLQQLRAKLSQDRLLAWLAVILFGPAAYSAETWTVCQMRLKGRLMQPVDCLDLCCSSCQKSSQDRLALIGHPSALQRISEM